MFYDFVARWYADSEYSAGTSRREGVQASIARAILNRPERECAFAFNSLEVDDDTWLPHMLSRYRIIYHESISEFDLLFWRLNRTAALRMLNLVM